MSHSTVGGFMVFALLLGLVAVMVAYFIPTMIAFSRDVPKKYPILALNVLLGWSLLGWVAALVWALTAES